MKKAIESEKRNQWLLKLINKNKLNAYFNLLNQ